MSFFFIWLISVSNSTPGQKANRLFPINNSACSLLDVKRLVARPHELLNHSWGLPIWNDRAVPMVVKFVRQPWHVHARECMVIDYSYGMCLLDSLKYRFQWVGISNTCADICVWYMYVCMCVKHIRQGIQLLGKLSARVWELFLEVRGPDLGWDERVV